MLVAVDVVRQTGKDMYQSTGLSRELATVEAKAMVLFGNEVLWQYAPKAPTYFRDQGYRNPPNAFACPWQYAMQTEKSYFDWLAANPTVARNFHMMLQGYSWSMSNWVSWTPTEKFFEEDDLGTTFLVDIGGSTGHDVQVFLQKHPSTRNRLICQDLKEVVEAAESAPEITMMAHNFFEQQPVQHARIYFLHSILHDWPDKQAKKILENIKPAIRRGYSKILVQDHIQPVQNLDSLSAAVDMMMVSVSSLTAVIVE